MGRKESSLLKRIGDRMMEDKGLYEILKLYVEGTSVERRALVLGAAGLMRLGAAVDRDLRDHLRHVKRQQARDEHDDE